MHENDGTCNDDPNQFVSHRLLPAFATMIRETHHNLLTRQTLQFFDPVQDYDKLRRGRAARRLRQFDHQETATIGRHVENGTVERGKVRPLKKVVRKFEKLAGNGKSQAEIYNFRPAFEKVVRKFEKLAGNGKSQTEIHNFRPAFKKVVRKFEKLA